MLQERRINKRISLSLPINYELLETDIKDRGTTVSKDISESGIRLVFKKFYSPKTKFLLKIDLEGINKFIETIAESVWSFNVRLSDTYYGGLRFLDLSQSNRKILQEYISMNEIINQ